MKYVDLIRFYGIIIKLKLFRSVLKIPYNAALLFFCITLLSQVIRDSRITCRKKCII